MAKWSDFVEDKKNGLMVGKDKFIAPLLKKISRRITPDSLTYFRILLAAGLYFLLVLKVPYLFGWAVIFYIICKFTDLLDGALARARGITSVWGGFIDVLADKIFYLIGFFVLLSLWSDFYAFHFMFLVKAVSITILLVNVLSLLFKKKVISGLRMFRRLFEIFSYFLGTILLILQWIVKC